MADQAYIEFLNRRIPELHSMGKRETMPPKPRDVSELAHRISLARQNTADSQFPGRIARLVADREWAERVESPRGDS